MRSVLLVERAVAMLVVACAVSVAGAEVKLPGAENTLSLAGTWQFKLDAEGKGVAEKWFARTLEETVRLPGTTDENQKGTKKDERCEDRLSRVYFWKGPAWYRREVLIPDAWKGKRLTLLLERTKNTRVWVDSTDCGTQDSLSAPQAYDLTAAMTPGRHSLTLLVDNSKLPPVGAAHAFDERTQTNWNGIVGKMEIRATDPVWLEDVQVYPDVEKKKVRVRAVVGNTTGRTVAAVLALKASRSSTPATAEFAPATVPVRAAGPETTAEFDYVLGDAAPLWDEFSPAMIRLTVSLEARAEAEHFKDTRTVDFGLRQFAARRNQFTINGRPTFLRGKLDCCIFPLTGYPPMDKAGWLRVLGIAKSYGINHYRFHSWCPPEAAFEAADELGMYLQPELPNKATAFQKPEHGGYLRMEGERIFRAYGNHPSFVMFTLGNELGRNEAMFEMVRHFRQTDPRHLYAQGSNNLHWQPALAEGDDFWVTCKTSKTLPVRGAFFQGDYDKAHIENRPPSTMVDFSESIAGVPVPVVGHETGEFQVSPDFREIPKYTGVTRARNLEIFRERLREAGMLDQAHDFVRASGALSVICHREDIEAALRTPGFGGFQLLDIQDFPGQGTALVGILNAFMESKGLIAPEAWRQFCCETVPLLRMEKYTWTTDETFTGRLQVAHYGPADLPGARIAWTVRDGPGERTVASGSPAPVTIAQGKVFDVGMLSFSLAGVKAPQKLTVEAAIRDTPFVNRYDLWVYSPKVETTPPASVQVVRTLDQATVKNLQEGGRVLLLPNLADLKHSIKGAFQTDFWCFPMFRRAAERSHIEVAPGTLGILCDPKCPALAEFPTEFHSNWQWWHLVKNSRPIILDETPATFRPLVQVIDNFERNHKLGLVFETRMGKGALLVCAIDLPGHQDKPEARQLYHSLLRYAASDAFAPTTELDIDLLNKMLSTSSAFPREALERPGRLELTHLR
jgi:hypothetical protein